MKLLTKKQHQRPNSELDPVAAEGSPMQHPWQLLWTRCSFRKTTKHCPCRCSVLVSTNPWSYGSLVVLNVATVCIMFCCFSYSFCLFLSLLSLGFDHDIPVYLLLVVQWLIFFDTTLHNFRSSPVKINAQAGIILNLASRSKNLKKNLPPGADSNVVKKLFCATYGVPYPL